MRVAKIDLNAGSAGARPVVNIEEWSSAPADDTDFAYREAGDEVSLDWTWDGTDFNAPEPTAEQRKEDAYEICRAKLADELAQPWEIDWEELIGGEIQKKDTLGVSTDAGILQYPSFGSATVAEIQLSILGLAMITDSHGDDPIAGFRDLSDAYELQVTASQFVFYFNSRTAIANDYRTYIAGVVNYIASLPDDESLGGGIASALEFSGAPWP
jgi:hypothetical protein